MRKVYVNLIASTLYLLFVSLVNIAIVTKGYRIEVKSFFWMIVGTIVLNTIVPALGFKLYKMWVAPSPTLPPMPDGPTIDI
jgi:hypothetical protein